MGNVARSTVNMAAETEIEVRTYLAQRGMKKDDLANFIEEAVRWCLLDLTLSEARSAFEDMLPEEMDELIGEALSSARTH